jgi:membrane-bound ClpP family serine protease
MTTIILLILAGFIFLILEFFVFPGVTVAGIGGILLVGTGVYIGYQNFGAPTGNVILALTIFAFLIVLTMAFRAKTWDKLMLKTSITANVESVTEISIHPGDKGITITRLNPIGKVRINNQEVEAHCPDNFVDPQTPIEVVSVSKINVVVKPIN